jgi:acetate kinase
LIAVRIRHRTIYAYRLRVSLGPSAWVIPTDEELMMAQRTLALVRP